MKTLKGRDTSSWNFSEWTRYFDEQDRQLRTLMAKDLDLIYEVGPDPKEDEVHYLDADASVKSVPPFLTAVRFLFAAQSYEKERGKEESQHELSGHAAYAAYQVIRSHELGYEDDRMMGVSMRLWRGFEIAKRARELLWKERSAIGASLETIKLHALAEKLEEELALWHGFLCEEHDYEPLLKVGPRRFLGSLLLRGLEVLWKKVAG